MGQAKSRLSGFGNIAVVAPIDYAPMDVIYAIPTLYREVLTAKGDSPDLPATALLVTASAADRLSHLDTMPLQPLTASPNELLAELRKIGVTKPNSCATFNPQTFELIDVFEDLLKFRSEFKASVMSPLRFLKMTGSKTRVALTTDPTLTPEGEPFALIGEGGHQILDLTSFLTGKARITEDLIISASDSLSLKRLFLDHWCATGTFPARAIETQLVHINAEYIDLRRRYPTLTPAQAADCKLYCDILNDVDHDVYVKGSAMDIISDLFAKLARDAASYTDNTATRAYCKTFNEPISIWKSCRSDRRSDDHKQMKEYLEQIGVTDVPTDPCFVSINLRNCFAEDPIAIAAGYLKQGTQTKQKRTSGEMLQLYEFPYGQYLAITIPGDHMHIICWTH